MAPTTSTACWRTPVRPEGGRYTASDPEGETLSDIRHILTDARQRGADAVVVTEKDWVKWQPLLERSAEAPACPPVVRPRLGVRFLDGANKLDAAIVR